MGVKCPECGKEVANERALAGHLYGVHGRRIGLRADVERTKENAEKALTLAVQHTEQLDHFLKEIDERLSRLERKLSEIEPGSDDWKARRKAKPETSRSPQEGFKWDQDKGLYVKRA